jgi:hypothetical protein
MDPVFYVTHVVVGRLLNDSGLFFKSCISTPRSHSRIASILIKQKSNQRSVPLGSCGSCSSEVAHPMIGLDEAVSRGKQNGTLC